MHLKICFTKVKSRYFTPVYASMNEVVRRELWKKIQIIALNKHHSWLIRGNFY